MISLNLGSFVNLLLSNLNSSKLVNSPIFFGNMIKLLLDKYNLCPLLNHELVIDPIDLIESCNFDNLLFIIIKVCKLASKLNVSGIVTK